MWVRRPFPLADARRVWAMNVSIKTGFAGRRLPVLVFGVTLGVFAASAAWAQTALDSPTLSTGRANRAAAAASKDKPEIAPPNAIPGSTARTPAAPASKTVGDLQPNEALFD